MVRPKAWSDFYTQNAEEINAIMLQCEKDGNFGKFRQIELIQKKRKAAVTAPTEDMRLDETQATLNAWDEPFVGKSALLFLKRVDKMNAARMVSKAIYANFITIVQSSGTGKSRMIDEASKYKFVIPINLRPKEDKSGFPPADSEIRDWLQIRGKETTLQFEIRTLWFLDSLFKTVKETLNGIMNLPYDTLAKRWREYLRSNRDDFYHRVALGFRSCNVLDINDEDQLKKELGTLTHSTIASLDAVILEIRSKNSNDPYPHTPDDPATILLCFDESFATTNDVTIDSPGLVRTAYQILCIATNLLYESSLFMVYLSTGSSLSKFSPSQRLFWSARARDAKIDPVQPPFVEVPFDQWKDKCIVGEGKEKLLTVCQPEFMARYGRPLFWTRWEHGSAWIRQDLVQFALAQLTGISRGKSANDPDRASDADFAAISMRILLPFGPARESVAVIENRLIQGHMRVVYSVPRHWEYMRAGTPSEPLLAEAAAIHMQGIADIPLVLRNFLNHTLISKGERGEVVVRLLLTLAHDHVLNERQKELIIGQRIFSAPVPVIDFIEDLVGVHANKIFESRSDNVRNSPTFREAFKDAVVHFTHFAKAGDSSVINDEGAWIAMARGMAWQCYDQQEQIDIVIPVLMDPSACLGRFVMSAILIQIKNRHHKTKVSIDANDLGFFTRHPEFSKNHPYIAMVMELGVQPTPTQQAKGREEMGKGIPPAIPSKVTTGPASLPRPRHRRAAKPAESEHARYYIGIQGCSNNVYPVIPSNSKYLFDQMLATKSLLEDHPHQDPESLGAVNGLKHAWTAGEAILGHIESLPELPSIIGAHQAPPSPFPERVIVHSFGEDEDGDL